MYIRKVFLKNQKRESLQLPLWVALEVDEFVRTKAMNLSALTACCGISARGFTGQFLGSFAKLRKASISFPHFCLCAWNKSAPIWADFHEIWYFGIFRRSDEKIQVSLKSGTNNGYLHRDQYTFFFISLSFLLRIRNVEDKHCTENRNTHLVSNNPFWKIVPFMVFEKIW